MDTSGEEDRVATPRGGLVHYLHFNERRSAMKVSEYQKGDDRTVAGVLDRGDSMARVYPRVITHIGATVVDIDKAIQWYQEILGFQLLAGPLNVVADDSHFGQIATDLWGSAFGGGRVAELTGAAERRCLARKT
jgi:catechol-2,3-dioxygenase